MKASRRKIPWPWLPSLGTSVFSQQGYRICTTGFGGGPREIANHDLPFLVHPTTFLQPVYSTSMPMAREIFNAVAPDSPEYIDFCTVRCQFSLKCDSAKITVNELSSATSEIYGCREGKMSRLQVHRWQNSIFWTSIQIGWYLPNISDTLDGKKVSQGLGILRWELSGPHKCLIPKFSNFGHFCPKWPWPSG